MNIHSCGCTNGYLYKYLCNEPMAHPLYWTGIIEKDFVRFCRDYEHLDISKVADMQYKDSQFYQHRDIYYWHHNGVLLEDIPMFRLENGVEVAFPNHLDNYREMYAKRIARFNKEDETLMVFNTWNYGTPDSLIQEFVDMDIPYKKVLLTGNTKFTALLNNDNLLVINSGRYIKQIAKDVARQIKQYYGL